MQGGTQAAGQFIPRAGILVGLEVKAGIFFFIERKFIAIEVGIVGPFAGRGDLHRDSSLRGDQKHFFGEMVALYPQLQCKGFEGKGREGLIEDIKGKRQGFGKRRLIPHNTGSALVHPWGSNGA